MFAIFGSAQIWWFKFVYTQNVNHQLRPDYKTHPFHIMSIWQYIQSGIHSVTKYTNVNVNWIHFKWSVRFENCSTLFSLSISSRQSKRKKFKVKIHWNRSSHRLDERKLSRYALHQMNESMQVARHSLESTPLPPHSLCSVFWSLFSGMMHVFACICVYFAFEKKRPQFNRKPHLTSEFFQPMFGISAILLEIYDMKMKTQTNTRLHMS